MNLKRSVSSDHEVFRSKSQQMGKNTWVYTCDISADPSLRGSAPRSLVEFAGFLKAQLVLGHVFPAACRFVVHCRREPFLSLSLEGSVGNVSPVFCFRFRSVFGRFGLGFRWCLAFSHPLPTRATFLSLSLEGSVGNVSPVFCFRFRSVFGRFGLGFRWCLAFSHPLPTRAIFVFVFRGFRRQRFASFLLPVS